MFTTEKLLPATLLSDYEFCERGLYLRYYKIYPQQDKTEFILGQLEHDKFSENLDINFSQVKVDKIKNGVLYEYKLTDSNKKGAYLQIKYYLYLLNKYYNVKISHGLLHFGSSGEIKEVLYDENTIIEIEQALGKITFLLQGKIPSTLNTTKCSTCLNREICLI